MEMDPALMGSWPYLRARVFLRLLGSVFCRGGNVFFNRIGSYKIRTPEKDIPVASLLNGLCMESSVLGPVIIFPDIPPGCYLRAGSPYQMGSAYAQY
jgi:hypothetical protein